eukprot:gene2405-2869_t
MAQGGGKNSSSTSLKKKSAREKQQKNKTPKKQKMKDSYKKIQKNLLSKVGQNIEKDMLAKMKKDGKVLREDQWKAKAQHQILTQKIQLLENAQNQIDSKSAFEITSLKQEIQQLKEISKLEKLNFEKENKILISQLDKQQQEIKYLKELLYQAEKNNTKNEAIVKNLEDHNNTLQKFNQELIRKDSSTSSPKNIGKKEEIIETTSENAHKLNQIYVSGFKCPMSKTTIFDMYSVFGPISYIKVHQHDGCCFIHFENEKDAIRAVENTKSTKYLDDNILNVRMARPDHSIASMTTKVSDTQRISKGTNASIHVTPIYFPCSLDELNSKFSIFGEIVSCRINKYDNFHGYGFVDFKDISSAKKTINKTNGTSFLDGRNVITVTNSFNSLKSSEDMFVIAIGEINLPFSKDDLISKFKVFGKIVQSKMFKKDDSKDSGFALIKYQDEESARHAIRETHNIDYLQPGVFLKTRYSYLIPELNEALKNLKKEEMMNINGKRRLSSPSPSPKKMK